MLYRHLGVDEKIFRIADPYFVNLIRNNSIAGSCCFCRRMTANGNAGLIPSFYLRYFSFKDIYRRGKVARKPNLRASALREEIRMVIDGEPFGLRHDEKSYLYAYVDPRNVRSAILCSEFGFEPVRQYASIVFNRIRLREKLVKQISKISPAEEPHMRELLAGLYRGYNMVSFENLFGGRQYYVIKNTRGRIIAGAQVNPDRWNILALPGLTGKTVFPVFSHIPYLNRLFNSDYRFLTIEGIYFDQEYVGSLEILFEALLSQFKLHHAIIMADVDSPLYAALRSIDLGFVDKIKEESRGDVICRFRNFTDAEKKNFTSSPAYISGIDVT
jgi:hypothetical protein